MEENDPWAVALVAAIVLDVMISNGEMGRYLALLGNGIEGYIEIF